VFVSRETWGKPWQARAGVKTMVAAARGVGAAEASSVCVPARWARCVAARRQQRRRSADCGLWIWQVYRWMDIDLRHHVRVAPRDRHQKPPLF
jgi:hypothetical protein